MDHVVAVEQVRRREVPVGLRVLRQIHREVEAQLGPAARARVEVRRVVGVLVHVGVDVVALRGDELGTDRLVDVMPAVRRGDRVRRVGHERAAGVVRALVRPREHAIRRPVQHRAGRRHQRFERLEGLRQLASLLGAAALELVELVVGRPVLLLEQRAGLRVDRRVPQMGIGGVVDLHPPGQLQALGGRLPAQVSLDRLVRDAAAGHRGRLRLAAAAARHPDLARSLELEPERGLCDRRRRIDELRIRRHRGQAHGRTAREDDLAIRADVDRDVASEDLEVPVALVHVHVRDPGPRRLVDAREGHIREVGARHPELPGVRVQIGARDVTRILRRVRRSCASREGAYGDEHR